MLSRELAGGCRLCGPGGRLGGLQGRRRATAVISRILTRLAVVWMVGFGGLVLAVGIFNGTLAGADWAVISALMLGPPGLALALAWVFAPRQ